MRTDVPAAADPTMQSRTNVTVTLYSSASPRDLIVGTEGLATRDLTPYAARMSHTSSEANITLRWHTELDGANRPAPGQVVRLSVGPYAVFTGHIDSISGDRVSRATGEKTCTIVVRRRDATAWWRDTRRITQIYSAGIDLAAIARDVATQLALTPEEYDLPDTGITLAHDSAQLADLNGWDMLSVALEPGLRVPLVDARGVLKAANRNVLRPADVVVPMAQVKEIGNALSRPPLATMRVKWLDPHLSRVDQQDQALSRTPISVTIGFFHPSVVVDIWWSEEHTQRADSTRYVELASSGLSIWDSVWGTSISVSYEQVDQYHGRLSLAIQCIAIGERLMADIAIVIAAIIAANSGLPKIITTVASVAEAAAISDALRTLTQAATGVFEIRGVPFDLIHAVNESEAYDQDAPEWRQQLEELQNDLIPNENVADALAVNELLWRARSASKATLPIADDLRIEVNDIVGLEDARKFFVEDFRRDLTRGADAILALDGFFV